VTVSGCAGNDWLDNDLRFGLLSYVGALLSSAGLAVSVEAGHRSLHDWQDRPDPGLPALTYQVSGRNSDTIQSGVPGDLPAETAARLGLPSQAFSVNGVEFYGKTSFLQGGLQFADRITDGQSDYAKKSWVNRWGWGCKVCSRTERMCSIEFSTARHRCLDPESARISSVTTTPPARRQAGQQARAATAHGPARPSRKWPLFGSVSRLTHQKGHDVLADIATELVKLPAQLVVLARRPQLQLRFQELANRTRAGLRADQLRRGSVAPDRGRADSFVMPSRFEALRPEPDVQPALWHAAGSARHRGLRDSVVDCTPRR